MGGYLTSLHAALQRPRLLRILSCLVGAVFFAAPAQLAAASPPDWLKPLLAEDVSAWKDKHAAVRLLDFRRTQYTGGDRVVELNRTAIRILSEAGRGEAHQAFTYNPDTSKMRTVRAWVVSADGKKTRDFGRGDFIDQIAQFSSHFWNSQRLLHLNGATAEVEIGGVIAFEFEVSQDVGFFDASCHFLDRLPVLHAVFEVVPQSGGRLEWNSSSPLIPAPVAGSGAGALRWQMDRVEPLSSTQPDRFLPNPLRVSVRGVAPGEAGRKHATWEEFSRAAAEIVEPRMEISATVATKASELIAGQATRWDRVRALCDFVQRDIAYLSVTLDKDSLAGYRPHPAGECLGNRYGDCKDKATLLCALLRSVGDQGSLMLVYSGNPQVVPPNWPSACFNHAIVAIPADSDTPAHWPVVDVPGAGRQVIFDATDPITPLGVLPREDQGGHALVAVKTGAGLVKLPGETDPSLGIRCEVRAKITPTGMLQATMSEDRSGDVAAGTQTTRTMLRADKFGESIESRIKAALPLARNVQWTEAWDAARAHFKLGIQFTSDRYLRPLGRERVMFSPLVLTATPSLDPWETSHDGTVWLPGFRTQETVRIELPEGFAIEELPQPSLITTPTVSIRIATRVDGKEVVTEREKVFQPGFLDKAAYEALRTLTKKVYEAERRPVILKRVAAAALPPAGDPPASAPRS